MFLSSFRCVMNLVVRSFSTLEVVCMDGIRQC